MDQPERHSPKTIERLVPFAAVAAGIGLRVALSLASCQVNPWTDMKSYRAIALSIAARDGLAAVDRPLLFPTLLATTYRFLASQDLLQTYLIQSILSILAVFAIAAYARILFGGQAARWTVTLLAPLLTFAQYSSLLLTETSFTVVFGLWLTCCLRHGVDDCPSSVFQVRRIAQLLLGGGLAGVGCLLRPSALSLAAGTALAIGIVNLDWRRLAMPSVFLLGLIVSYTGGHRGIMILANVTSPPVPTLGINLYLGNSSAARWDGGGLVELPADLEAIKDPIARDAEALRRAIGYMKDHPLKTVALASVRAVRLLGINPGRVEHESLVADGVPSILAIGWLAVEWWVVVLAAGTSFDLIPRCRSTLPIAAAVGGPYLVVLLFTFVQTRFRLPIFLLLVPVAAAGLAEFYARATPSLARGLVDLLPWRWTLRTRILAAFLLVTTVLDVIWSRV